MDTEFPGTIHQPTKHYTLDQRERYELIKTNVNDLKVIQVALTLYNPDSTIVYEFNLRDFDLHTDSFSKQSIELLKRQGIDFERNRKYGIYGSDFSRYLLSASGLFDRNSNVTWLTFHGCYDYAYLIKILTRSKLPDKVDTFMELVKTYFGTRVYDLKHLVKFCQFNLYGGLERVASDLGVERMFGESHQSGSDSLLTLHTFLKIVYLFFQGVNLEKEFGSENMLPYNIGLAVY